MPSSSAARQHASPSVRDGTQRDACCMQPAMKHKQSAKSLVGHQTNRIRFACVVHLSESSKNEMSHV